MVLVKKGMIWPSFDFLKKNPNIIMYQFMKSDDFIAVCRIDDMIDDYDNSHMKGKMEVKQRNINIWYY